MSFFDSIKPPEIISKDGHLIDSLFYYTTWINVIYFGLVCAALAYLMYFYSSKKNPTPMFTYGNKKIHVLTTTLLGALVFLSVDVNITRISNNDMVSTFWNNPKEYTKIEVIGYQWAWSFRYPNPQGEFNTSEDLVLTSEVRIPVNIPVVFQIASQDVIHSFSLPQTRLKTDAIPGLITRLWFHPIKTGTFDVVCAEMCGPNHYLMKGKLIVMEQKDYQEWLEKSYASNFNTSADTLSYWGWKWKD